MYENLQLGDTGEDVKILQEKLKILGFYNPIITGEYGLATEEGVSAYQRSRNIRETGRVDEETWESILEETEPKIMVISSFPTLSFGSTGSYVTDLQTKLKALLYYSGTINGEFDLETEIAVKRFQLNNDLTASGTVNSSTWNVLNSLYGNLNSCVLDNGDTGVDNNGNTEVYIVKSGDTLYAIARRFNTTVDEIKRLNNLTSDTLQIGQQLIIPTTKTDNYFEYIVVAGDSLSVLAERFNTTIAEIKSLNNLTSDVIRIGQTLKIPTSTTNEKYIDYVVSSGDTLYAIAVRYDTSVATLKSINNLTSNILQIGQVLKIPITSGTNYINYTVKSGDTLYAIASRYNTTVNEIKQLNNLSSNFLSVGQTLKIPV